MRRTGLLALTAVAMLAVGCGDDSDDASGDAKVASGTAMAKSTGEAAKADAAMANAARRKRRGKVIKIVRSRYGRVIADGKGEAFYLFDKENRPKSRCYGACAVAWPPVLTKGKPRAGKGARARLLGTTRRRGGRRQVTYAGQPLYYYKDDAPGTILCHNVDEFGGLWLVVKPNGRAVG